MKKLIHILKKVFMAIITNVSWGGDREIHIILKEMRLLED